MFVLDNSLYSLEAFRKSKACPSNCEVVSRDDKRFKFVEFKAQSTIEDSEIVIVPDADWILYHKGTSCFYSGNGNSFTNAPELNYIGKYSTASRYFIRLKYNGKGCLAPRGATPFHKEEEILKMAKKDTKINDTENIKEENKMAKKDTKNDVIEEKKTTGAAEEIETPIIAEDITTPTLEVDTDDLSKLGSSIGEADFKMPDIDNLNTGDVAPSDAFTDGENADKEVHHLTDEEKAARKAKAEAREAEAKAELEVFQGQITQYTGGTAQTADLTSVQAFNKLHGRLYGYVTANDAQLKAATKLKYTVDADGKKQLADGVSDEIATKAKLPGGLEGLDKQYLAHTYDLTFKQMAPGKVLGAVIATPLGGLKDIAELQQVGSVVSPETEKTALVKQLYTVAESAELIAYLYGCRIKEAPETFGAEAGWVKAGATRRTVTVKETQDKQRVVTSFLKPENRKNKMTATSYFPITTYSEITIDGALTPEQAEACSRSMFWHLFKPGTDSSATTKASALGPEFVTKIRRDENTKEFSSDYFTPDVATRTAIKAPSCFSANKEEFMDPVKVPLKALSTTKEHGKETAKYISVKCTNVAATPELENISSLNQVGPGGKFEVFYNAAKGTETLTEDTLKALTPKRSSSKTASNTVSDESFLAILAAGNKVGGAQAVPGLVLNGVGSGGSLKEKLANTKMSASLDATASAAN